MLFIYHKRSRLANSKEMHSGSVVYTNIEEMERPVHLPIFDSRTPKAYNLQIHLS